MAQNRGAILIAVRSVITEAYPVEFNHYMIMKKW